MSEEGKRVVRRYFEMRDRRADAPRRRIVASHPDSDSTRQPAFATPAWPSARSTRGRLDVTRHSAGLISVAWTP